MHQVLALGADIVIHSVTKYLAGHNDVLAGALAGSSDLVAAVRSAHTAGCSPSHAVHTCIADGTHEWALQRCLTKTALIHVISVSAMRCCIPQVRLMHNVLGGTIDPHAAFLVTRGLKTLALRVRHVNDSALELAKRLEAHPKIARVHYPGGCRPLQGWPLQRLQRYARCLSAWLCMLLAAVDDAEVLHTMWRAGLPSHPDHEIAKAQMDGFGGVISFEVLQRTAATMTAVHHATKALHAACWNSVGALLQACLAALQVDGDMWRTAKLVDSVELPYIAPSLGGCESLIEQPTIVSYWDQVRGQLAACTCVPTFAHACMLTAAVRSACSQSVM